jgi:hypothetical protein
LICPQGPKDPVEMMVSRSYSEPDKCSSKITSADAYLPSI